MYVIYSTPIRSLAAKVTHQKLPGELSAIGCDRDGFRLALRIRNPTSLIQRIEKIPIHPFPGPRFTMVGEHREAENRQRGFAQPVVIEIGWKCHDHVLTPYAAGRRGGRRLVQCDVKLNESLPGVGCLSVWSGDGKPGPAALTLLDNCRSTARAACVSTAPETNRTLRIENFDRTPPGFGMLAGQLRWAGNTTYHSPALRSSASAFAGVHRFRPSMQSVR